MPCEKTEVSGVKIVDNIILIGMPGSGKSSVGVVLAKALGLDFLDVDLRTAWHGYKIC